MASDWLKTVMIESNIFIICVILFELIRYLLLQLLVCNIKSLLHDFVLEIICRISSHVMFIKGNSMYIVVISGLRFICDVT